MAVRFATLAPTGTLEGVDTVKLGGGGGAHPALLRSRLAQARGVLAWTDVRFVLTLFLVAQALDALTTYVALTGHHFDEANPVFGTIADEHPVAAVALKFVLAGFVGIGLVAIRLRWRMRLIVITLFAIASFAAPVMNTLRLMGLAP